jgi:hypothetical protein
VALAEGVGRRARVAKLGAGVGDAEQPGVAIDRARATVPAVAVPDTPSSCKATVPVAVDAPAVDGLETMRSPRASRAKRSRDVC